MSKMMTAAIAMLGLAIAPAAMAQNKAAKPTVSAQQMTCELTGDCEPSTATGTYATGAEQPFSLDPTSGKVAPKKTAASVTTATPAGRQALVRPARAQGNPGVARPMAHRAPGPSDLQITFLVGTADMTPVGQANADVLAKVLASPKLTGMRVRIEGHTDAQGARDMNMTLSQKRAEAIVDYLVAHGIAKDRLEAQGFGFDKPLPGKSAMSPANRRAVAIVIK